MVWGRTKNARNGGWFDYSNGKGRGGFAAGGWRGERPRQNRGDRGSRGAKDARPKETVPAFLKAWTVGLDKKMAAMQKQIGQPSEGPAKQQDGKNTKWECPYGYCNFGFRQQCKACEKPRSEVSPAVGGTQAPGVMEVDSGAA